MPYDDAKNVQLPAAFDPFFPPREKLRINLCSCVTGLPRHAIQNWLPLIHPGGRSDPRIYVHVLKAFPVSCAAPVSRAGSALRATSRLRAGLSMSRAATVFISIFLVFIFGFCVFLLAASAQDATGGAIRGIVDDPHGLRIAGATVAIVNIDTGMRRFATSDTEGRFV